MNSTALKKRIIHTGAARVLMLVSVIWWRDRIREWLVLEEIGSNRLKTGIAFRVLPKPVRYAIFVYLRAILRQSFSDSPPGVPGQPAIANSGSGSTWSNNFPYASAIVRSSAHEYLLVSYLMGDADSSGITTRPRPKSQRNGSTPT